MARKSKTSDMGCNATNAVIYAPVTGDPWDRIVAQAKADMLHKGRLFWAVESMIREQAWTAPTFLGECAEDVGGVACDLCGRVADFEWQRTAKQLKAMAGPKVKGSKAQAVPVSHRCALHVPVIFPELGENYRDARVSLSGAA